MNPDLYQELVKQINSLQKQVDALVKPEVGRWVDWTPTVTQGVAVTRTINYAKYIVLNDFVFLAAVLTTTSAGTAGSIIQVAGLPVNPAFTADPFSIGSFLIYDVGTAYYQGSVSVVTNVLYFIAHGLTSGVGTTPNFGLVNGDKITFTIGYKK